MTTRKRTTRTLKQQQESENVMISTPTQQELEHFFTDPEPIQSEEVVVEPDVSVPPSERKRVRPPKTGKVFLGEEDIRHFDAYKKFLKEEQGIKKIKHKPI